MLRNGKEPFNFDVAKPTKESPEILMISSSTGPYPADFLARFSYDTGIQEGKVRGRDFIEYAVPGGYVSPRDIDDIAGLLVHNSITQVTVIVQEDSDFIHALAQCTQNRDFLSPLYRKRLACAITDLRKSGMSQKEIELLSPKGLTHAVSGASALNIAQGLMAFATDVERKSSVEHIKGERENTYNHLRKVRVAAYVISGKSSYPEVVIDFNKISTLARARSAPQSKTTTILANEQRP